MCEPGSLRPLLSPLLHLFSNAELLEMYRGSGINTSAAGFVDDVNVLAYSTIMEESCSTLERLHTAHDRQARRHGAVAAPEIYEDSEICNMNASANISTQL